MKCKEYADLLIKEGWLPIKQEGTLLTLQKGQSVQTIDLRFDTVTKGAGLGTTDNNPVVGNIAWNNPNNITASDNINAVVTSVATGAQDYAVRIIKSDGTLGATNKADIVNYWPAADTVYTYGGSTDLWGATWTPADINNANFGVAIAVNMGGNISYWLKATNFGFAIPTGATINGITVNIEKHCDVIYDNYAEIYYAYANVDYISITITYTPPITLIIQDTSHSHTIDNLTLTQIHNLAIQDTLHSHTIDNLNLTQIHNLDIQDTSHSHPIDNLDLTQIHNLAIQDTSHSHAFDSIDLIQDYLLAIQDALHSHILENIALISDGLIISDLIHSQNIDNLDLTQIHNLTIQDTSHSQVIENLILVQQHLLAIQDILHSQQVANIDLIQNHILAIGDVLHTQGIDGLSVIQNILLTIENILLSQGIDVLDLIQRPFTWDKQANGNQIWTKQPNGSQDWRKN